METLPSIFETLATTAGLVFGIPMLAMAVYRVLVLITALHESEVTDSS